MSLPKEKFFEAMEAQGLALTYQDVRVQPMGSEVSWRDVDIAGHFSKHIELPLPFVSAAMDTVTEADMAIALAKAGGLGVIHAALSPQDQFAEARRVKRHLNGVIEEPVTVQTRTTVKELQERRTRLENDFTTFPVVNKRGELKGLMTGKSFDFCEDDQAPIESVMQPLADLVVAPQGTDVHSAYQMMKEKGIGALPVVDNDGVLKQLYVLSDVIRIVRGNPDKYCLDGKDRLRVGIAVPTDEGALERVDLMRKFLDVAVIDSAQGDTKYAKETLVKLKAEFPNIDVVVGNVSYGPSAVDLAELGADGIKVGQGPGSICSTRRETGIGLPQVTAIYNCVKALQEWARETGKEAPPVCADGGIIDHGDTTIAMALGASSIMMGKNFAGTDEAPPEIVFRNGAPYMLYRGMGSAAAMRDSSAAQARYGASGVELPLAEGVEAFVPYQGSVAGVASQFAQGLSKGMGYIGAQNLEVLAEKAQLNRVTAAGQRETSPHSVEVISTSSR